MKKLGMYIAAAAMVVATSAYAASDVTGAWLGKAYHVGGITKYNHDTQVTFNCTGTSGTATYTYEAFGVTCHSTLTLDNRAGNVWTYNDTTQSPEDCQNGKVTITVDPSSPLILFQWRFPNGTVDTQGQLWKSGNVLCPLFP